MYFYDFRLWLFISPAILLALWAQFRVKSTYAAASRVRANLSGAAAARHILNSAGLYDVGIEAIGGHLSDHYDPRARVLRLSPEVYSHASQAAVGIAAHEAGHAIQHARHYAPLAIRNAAVPAANFGSSAAMFLLIGGMMLNWPGLFLLGIAAFSAVV
ncbi:MAG: zinc metallopeptidase, partial [Planctomycetales bacterium]|nr:zinc metallopeptidase [Planctomycetales bacterium]